MFAEVCLLKAVARGHCRAAASIQLTLFTNSAQKSSDRLVESEPLAPPPYVHTESRCGSFSSVLGAGHGEQDISALWILVCLQECLKSLAQPLDLAKQGNEVAQFVRIVVRCGHSSKLAMLANRRLSLRRQNLSS